MHDNLQSSVGYAAQPCDVVDDDEVYGAEEVGADDDGEGSHFIVGFDAQRDVDFRVLGCL